MIVEKQCHYRKKEQPQIGSVTYFNQVVLLGKIFYIEANGNNFFNKILNKYKKDQYTENPGICSETVKARISC